MAVEIRPGPAGSTGGKPFPQVEAEMKQFQKAARVMPIVMRVLPDRLKVKLTPPAAATPSAPRRPCR